MATKATLQEQYEFIRGSREVVFQYCKGMDPSDFVKEVDAFGRGSIRSTLVHMANVYEFWIGRFALEAVDKPTAADGIGGIGETVRLYEQADSLMGAYLERYGDSPGERIAGKLIWREEPLDVSALQLFTHVVTHEFHHKGQLMTMGRILGYVPPDADIIRF